MLAVQGPVSPRKIILQIDGSLSHRSELERAISHVRPGTIVHSFDDGPSALEHLTLCGDGRTKPHLVLLSHWLPGEMDGYEVLQKVRALALLRTLPVILVHSDEKQEDVARAQALGASAYMRKPVEKRQYHEFARQIVDESWSEVGPKLTGNHLALSGSALGSPPTMALQTDVASLLHPTDGEQTLLQKVVNFLGWCQDKAEASLDPFQVAFAKACRAHKLTAAQARRSGGSQPLREARRLVVIDLLIEKWPDETLLEEMAALNPTELKRIKARARAKVGPKLDLCRR